MLPGLRLAICHNLYICQWWSAHWIHRSRHHSSDGYEYSQLLLWVLLFRCQEDYLCENSTVRHSRYTWLHRILVIQECILQLLDIWSTGSFNLVHGVQQQLLVSVWCGYLPVRISWSSWFYHTSPHIRPCFQLHSRKQIGTVDSRQPQQVQHHNLP